MAVLPLRYFSPDEFRCKDGCGAGIEHMDPEVLRMLDEARKLDPDNRALQRAIEKLGV